MRKIESLSVVKIHDTSPRWRGKCSVCGKVRLRTQITLKNSRKMIVVYWLCNECLTRTPEWS